MLTLVEADPEDDVGVEEGPDGSVVVDLRPSEGEESRPRQAASKEGVRENLAEGMSTADLSKIAQDILDYVDADIESRSDWMRRRKQGLEQCGAIGKGPSPLVQGASTAIHPLIMEACVQFQARAIEEMFPPEGPVKTKVVVNEATQELEEQADRVKSHMNWQLTIQDRGYFRDMDSMLFALPWFGSTFRKASVVKLPGKAKKVARSRYILPDYVIVSDKPEDADQYPRTTHWLRLSPDAIKRKQEDGEYRDDVTLSPPDLSGEQPEIDVKHEADGTVETDLEDDALHDVYETHLRYTLPGEDEAKDLIITVERKSSVVLAIYDNTDEDTGELLNWFIHYRFLPGLGYYGWGYPHAIGGLQGAATEALRALLDGGLFATYQGGFKSKEAKFTGKDGNVVQLRPGIWTDVDATAEEVKSAFHTPPFKEPSNALFNTLGLIVTAGQRFASTTEAVVGEGAKDIPVGTTIARIEQGLKVYSAIHKRIHDSMGQEFRLLAKLNGELLDETEEFGPAGVIYRRDYDERIDVEPVSDPNIVSATQRVAIAQGVMERATQRPDLYDAYEVERRYLQALKVPDIDQVLHKPGQVPRVDPVTEGALLMVGRAIKAYPEQNHQAHIAIHQAQAQMLQGAPNAQQAVPAIMAHIAEHMAMAYLTAISVQMGIPFAMPDQDPDKVQPLPPEIENQIAAAAAQAMPQMMQVLAAPPPVDAQAALQEQAKQFQEQAKAMQQQMKDAEGAIQELARKTESDQQTIATLTQQLNEAKLAVANREVEVLARKDTEIEVARIKHDEAISVAEASAVSEQALQRVTQAVEKMVGNLEKNVADQIAKLQEQAAIEKAEAKGRESAEAEKGEGSAEKGEKAETPAAMPSITVGPIVIEQAAAGPRTIEIKKTDTGYVGVATDADQGGAKKKETEGKKSGGNDAK